MTPRSCAPTLSNGTGEGMNIQPSILCMADTQPNTAVSDEMCGALSAHSKKDPPVACTAVSCIASNGQDVIGALCARDGKGVGSQFVTEGKVICVESGDVPSVPR